MEVLPERFVRSEEDRGHLTKLGASGRDTSASPVRPFSDSDTDLMWLAPPQYFEIDLLARCQAGDLLSEVQTLRRCAVHREKQISQLNVCGSRRGPRIHAADCGDCAGASPQVRSGRVVDPEGLEAHSNVRLRKMTVLLDERHDPFNRLCRDSEDTPERSWYRHGGDRAIHVDDCGSFEHRIRPNVDLEPSSDCSATS